MNFSEQSPTLNVIRNCIIRRDEVFHLLKIIISILQICVVQVLLQVYQIVLVHFYESHHARLKINGVEPKSVIRN